MKLPQARVLVADDDPEMRDLLEVSIGMFGCASCVVVHDGLEALQALQRQTFDLVVCDWFMPHMKGIDLLRIMRAERHWRKVPFIMVTAEATSEDIEEAVHAGCTDYIIKPFNVKVLEDRIRKALR